MPSKTDPYATKSAHAADLILVLFALLAILLAVGTAPHHQSQEGKSPRAPVSTLATK